MTQCEFLLLHCESVNRLFRLLLLIHKSILQLLFFLLVLLSPVQLGRHWWPDWSLVHGVRVDYLSPTLYATDILLVALVASCAKNWIVASRVWMKRSSKKRFLVSAVFIYYLLSTIFSSPRPLLALYWMFRYLEIPLVAYFSFSLTKSAKPLIQLALSIAIIFSVTLGVIQILIGKTTGQFWVLGERSFTLTTPGISTISIMGRTILRPYATFSHPNALAGWLALSIFLIPKSFSKIVAAIGVVLSASRVALASLAAALLFPLLFSLSPFSFSFIGFPKESIKERILLHNAALNMFWDHPFFGFGPGHFIVKLPEYLPPGTWLLQPVHNVFLLFLSEFGVVGVFIGLMCLIRLMRHMRHIKFQKSWLPIFIVLLGTSLADHYWLTAQQNRILLGIALGIILSSSERR